MQWKKEIDSKVELPNGKQLPVILCGNKVSLQWLYFTAEFVLC